MPFIKKQYREIVNDLLEQITHGIAKEKHIFNASIRKYDSRMSTGKQAGKGYIECSRVF